MDINLSSDSDALICVLYAEYLERRAHSVPIEDALSFSDDFSIRDSFFPDWLPEDVTTVCGWLINKGLLIALPADDHFLDVELTEDGIIYMESRYARKRESVIAHIRDLVNLGISVGGFFLQ